MSEQQINEKILTKYEVLVPAYSAVTDRCYRSTGYVYFETDEYKSKPPEWIKNLLVESGEYPSSIRVIRA